MRRGGAGATATRDPTHQRKHWQPQPGPSCWASDTASKKPRDRPASRRGSLSTSRLCPLPALPPRPTGAPPPPRHQSLRAELSEVGGARGRGRSRGFGEQAAERPTPRGGRERGCSAPRTWLGLFLVEGRECHLQAREQGALGLVF